MVKTNNKGKSFENHVKKSFLDYPNTSVDRVNDNIGGYAGARGICDFIVYHYPYEVYVECKCHYGNTFPFSNITGFADKPERRGKITQWSGLLEKSKIDGVTAGVILWLIDKDITIFLDIRDLQKAKEMGYKSVGFHTVRTYSFPEQTEYSFALVGRKKIEYYDYSMEYFFEKIGEMNNG